MNLKEKSMEIESLAIKLKKLMLYNENLKGNESKLVNRQLNAIKFNLELVIYRMEEKA